MTFELRQKIAEGFNNEAEGYAASLRQMAEWLQVNDAEGAFSDYDELRATADFIDRQQAEIEALKHDIERYIEIASSLPNGDRDSG